MSSNRSRKSCFLTKKDYFFGKRRELGENWNPYGTEIIRYMMKFLERTKGFFALISY